MISIIICSRNRDIPEKLKQNISETIGVEYELVVIDNSKNNYSIFSAYNEGARRAKYSILCFSHDDILFRTENWGILVLKHLSDNNVGILGFAGTHFLPNVPTYWWTSPFYSEHNLTNDNGKIIECFKHDFFCEKSIVDAVVCDGFCFFAQKKLFIDNRIDFDEINYSGFHFYDMDICMQVLKTDYRVCLCNDILIEHFWSESEMTNRENARSFIQNRNVFFDKWKNYLPISKGINQIPPYVLERVNNLYRSGYDAEKARNSKAYKIGKFILAPFKFFKNSKIQKTNK
jgi:GT2 family glycosyltransferase